MLPHTFCHIHGIGVKTEQRLWQAGVTEWQKWNDSVASSLSARAKVETPEIFEESLDALKNANANFFADRLASGEQWRLFSQFRSSLAYIDIETTGLAENSDITTIALYDGTKVYAYVNGENLDDFLDDIQRYSVLVSYNGKCFDIPFIEHFFRVRLPHAQIDLRYVLAKLGIKGGLKGCERQLGINRGELDGVDGSFAVALWQLYERENNAKALETLLAYNIEDTVNLERLMVEAWNRNIAQTPFSHLFLPFPEPPHLPYHPDPECLRRLIPPW